MVRANAVARPAQLARRGEDQVEVVLLAEIGDVDEPLGLLLLRLWCGTQTDRNTETEGADSGRSRPTWLRDEVGVVNEPLGLLLLRL